MDSKHIELLLAKYWKCETSLEEEKELRDYFKGTGIPDSMNETANLFRFFEEEKNKSLSESFDQVVTKQVQQRHGGKIINMISWVQMARIAAGVAVVVAATYFIRQEVRKADPVETALVDTYSDPQIAFEETKKALMMISKGFGKAKSEAGKMKVFNDAEKKIQGKELEKDSANI
jgi:hypothetical protein